MLNITGFTRNFGRLALLFTAIPLLILSIVGSHTLGRFTEYEQSHQTRILETQLDATFAGVSRNAFLLKRVYALQNHAQRVFHRPAEIGRLHKALETSLGLPIHMYLYEGASLVASFSPHATGTALLERFFSILQLKGADFAKAQRDSQKELMMLFGPGSRLELMRRLKGILRRYNNDLGQGAFYWNQFGKKRGILIVFPKIPPFSKRFSLFRQRGPDSCGGGDPARNEWIPPFATTAEQMHLAWQNTKGTGNSACVFAGKQWVFAQSREGFVLCATAPVNARRGPRALLIAIWAGYLLAGILGLLFLGAEWGFAWGQNVVERIDGMSIRFRLLTMFVMATMLPLGLALLIGTITLADRTEVLADEASKGSLQRLQNIEQAYVERLESLKRLCRTLRNSAMAKEGDVEKLAKTAAALQRKEAIQHLELRDGLGNIIFSTYDPEVHGVSRAFDVFSKLTIRKHAPLRMGQHIHRITPEELLSESVMSTDEIGIATLLREPGRLWMFKMGTRPSLWYWDVYADSESKPAFIGIVHQLEFIFRDRLQEIFLSTTASMPLQIGFELGPEGGNLNPIPHFSASGLKSLIKAALRCQETGNILNRELVINKRRYWVTLKPEIEVGMYVLADLTPVDDLLASLRPIRWRLGGTAALAILVALLGASLLARLFILPIDDIGKGIQAINRRDSTFRIPIRRNDEFGTVAEAFNYLLEEMKELQYGRVVQESLLPASSSAPPGYTAACFRRTANDLAGDYHDIVELEEGNWAYILGDVTGHGISAALAMAMAKATVDYQSLAGWTFPSQVMDHLNALFNRELKPRHKFMTLGCLVLNEDNHRIVAENAGHPYPLVYRAATETIEELPIPSMPLGARKKRAPGSQSTILEPGDAVMLYSDGFIECTNPRGKMFGYPRFMELFRTLLAQRISVDDIIKALGKALDDFRAPGPYPDDVTLVLLQRNPTYPPDGGIVPPEQPR